MCWDSTLNSIGRLYWLTINVLQCKKIPNWDESQFQTLNILCGSLKGVQRTNFVFQLSNCLSLLKTRSIYTTEITDSLTRALKTDFITHVPLSCSSFIPSAVLVYDRRSISMLVSSVMIVESLLNPSFREKGQFLWFSSMCACYELL